MTQRFKRVPVEVIVISTAAEIMLSLSAELTAIEVSCRFSQPKQTPVRRKRAWQNEDLKLSRLLRDRQQILGSHYPFCERLLRTVR